jgi:hypothetical protein
MISVPEVVWKVKVLEVVALPPGASVVDGVSVPTPNVTPVAPGDTGLPNGSTPVDQLPVVS